MLAWYGPIRTGLEAGPESMLRWTKPMLEAELVAKGEVCTTKTLVTAAVEVGRQESTAAQDKRKDGRYAGRVRLSIADDRSAGSLVVFVESAVMPGALVITDDWSGYASLRKRGYDQPHNC